MDARGVEGAIQVLAVGVGTLLAALALSRLGRRTAWLRTTLHWLGVTGATAAWLHHVFLPPVHGPVLWDVAVVPALLPLVTMDPARGRGGRAFVLSLAVCLTVFAGAEMWAACFSLDPHPAVALFAFGIALAGPPAGAWLLFATPRRHDREGRADGPALAADSARDQKAQP